MTTTYVYLFRDSYTEEHIGHMIFMLLAMDECVDEFELESFPVDRSGLNALEFKIYCSKDGQAFLEHMSKCDMLYISSTRIES